MGSGMIADVTSIGTREGGVCLLIFLNKKVMATIALSSGKPLKEFLVL